MARNKSNNCKLSNTNNRNTDSRKERRKLKREDDRSRRKVTKKLHSLIKKSTGDTEFPPKNQSSNEIDKHDEMLAKDDSEQVREKLDCNNNRKRADMKTLQRQLRKGQKQGETNKNFQGDFHDAVEERVLAKRREKELSLHESFTRKKEMRLKFQRSQLEHSIADAESYLRAWYIGKKEYLRERERRKKQQKFDPTRLRGAAKPAEEAYPHLYPEYHEEKERKKIEDEEAEQSKGEDVLAKYVNHWGNHAETRTLLISKVALSRVRIAQAYDAMALGKKGSSSAKSHFNAAYDLLKNVVEMDSDCYLGSRIPWLLTTCLIEMDDLVESRAVVEKELQRVCKKENLDAFVCMLKWDLFFLEFLSTKVLEEEGSSEDNLIEAGRSAVAANPAILFMLLNVDQFDDQVVAESVDTIVSEEHESAMRELNESKISEPKHIYSVIWTLEQIALVYFVRSISWWRDLSQNVLEYLTSNFTENDNLSLYMLGLQKKYENVQVKEGAYEESFIMIKRRMDNKEDGCKH